MLVHLPFPFLDHTTEPNTTRQTSSSSVREGILEGLPDDDGPVEEWGCRRCKLSHMAYCRKIRAALHIDGCPAGRARQVAQRWPATASAVGRQQRVLFCNGSPKHLKRHVVVTFEYKK